MGNSPGKISVTIPSAAAAYSAGDQVGIAVEIPAWNKLQRKTRIEHCVAVSIADIAPAMDFLFFDSDPGAGITSADNDAYAMSDAATAKVIGSLHILAADWVDYGAQQVCSNVNLRQLGEMSGTSTSIWIVAVTRSAVTFEANSLRLDFRIDQIQ